jgi:hypothetical protein
MFTSFLCEVDYNSAWYNIYQLNLKQESKTGRKGMVLSFGEIPQEHEVVNIAYAFAQQKQSDWFNGELPIDPVMRVVSMLEQQAAQLKADGVKNISIQILEGVDNAGNKVINVWGMGTIIKLK